MTWTTPRTWVAGEIVTAAMLNTHVRDNLAEIGDPWTSGGAPTWTGSDTNPALGNGTLGAWYLAAGKLILFRIVLVIGSTTTFGSGIWGFTLPYTATVSGGRIRVDGGAYDSSGTADYPITSIVSGAALSLRGYPTALGGPLVRVSPTAPFTWATGDILTMTGGIEST